MRAKTRPIKKKKKSFLRIFFRHCLCLFVCGLVSFSVVLLYFANGLPDLKNLKTEIRFPGVTIQTYDGKILGTYGDLYEELVKLEDLPKYVPEAFIAIEDKRFFHHFGIDFIGFCRAIYQNYIARKVIQGGSTITQQLAKNILIAEGIITHYDKTIKRKIKELLLAFWLEYRFSKADIMMLYINRVYFGAGTYGIDAASRKYFNKSSTKLSIFEAAILAGLLKAPTKYNPGNHPNYAYERALVVLKMMEEQGYIKDAKEIEKKQAKSAFANSPQQDQNCMYFCDYAYEQAKKILGEIEDDIVIITTLDDKKQTAAEASVDFYVKTEGDNYKFSEASFICLNRDGAILAMVGGTKYSATQFNRAVQANRLPGSAFKIFVYGAAIEYGFQLEDKISDEPISISNWRPKNYKWKSRGEISLLDGFTHSVNTVSIRLAQFIGLERVSKFAKKLGIFDVSIHDMSVAIGTTPVTLKDITSAYTSFMDGIPIWPYCITEIQTKSGDILFQKNKEKILPIIDEEALISCKALLRNVVKNGTGRAVNVNAHIYGKTGTNGNTDAWFVGFYDPPDDKNSGFSMGVWIGNDINRQKMIETSTGGRIPARIAKMFFLKLLSNDESVAEKTFLKEVDTGIASKKPGLGALLGM